MYVCMECKTYKHTDIDVCMYVRMCAKSRTHASHGAHCVVHVHVTVRDIHAI
jgi:hypothetical protein